MSPLPERSKKFLTEPCVVCGDKRESQAAHFPKRARDGGEHTIQLCPTHHRVLDHGRVTPQEMERIWRCCFPRVRACDVHEFLRWAHDQGYPYSRFSFATPTELVSGS